MWEVRWQRGFGPPLMAAMATVLAAGITQAADGRSHQAVPVHATGSGCSPIAGASGRVGAWYQHRAVVDPVGRLRGYTLEGGTLAGGTVLRVSLPAESFAAGPFGDLVLYGRDDGRTSEVRVAYLSDGCDERLVTTVHVARGATLSAAAGTLYVHLVDRRTRADRGVWRYPLHGRGAPERVLPGLADPADGPFGRTFGTFFTWSATGRTLAVQSCGSVACRTRLLDPADLGWSLDASPDQGELLGLTDTERYGYAACHGLPCPIIAISRTGTRRTAIASAGVAAFVADGRGGRIAYEVAARGGGVAIRARSVVGGQDRLMAGPASGLRLAWPARWADAGTTPVAGRVLATRDGTWSSADHLRRASLLSLSGLRRITMMELLP